MRAALDFSPPGPLAAVADEPEVLTARAWGDSMDGLREDALRRGRGWFGPDARLKVLEISDVTSSLIRDPVPGSTYRATVLVRCLDGEPEPSMESAS
jgi:hypothetical protein